MRRTWHNGLMVCVFVALGINDANGQSLNFIQNAAGDHEYARHVAIPDGFGDGEFTLELWILPDDGPLVGPTTEGTPQQLINWSDSDFEPYSSNEWWFAGNFLLDGHNNNACCGFQDGTFSLQFYGGGRVRWLFGDGASGGPGGVWSIGAYPATTTPSLLDGEWHQLTLVRRWPVASGAELELWIDGALVGSETSTLRTDMTFWWDTWPGFGSQAGWFWGSEKQAAIGVLLQYEDYKGLIDEVRFWSRAKSPSEIAQNFSAPVNGNEAGLVGRFAFEEAVGTTTCDALTPSLCMSIVNAEPSIWSTQNAPLVAAVPGLSLIGIVLLLGSVLAITRGRERESRGA